MLSIAKFTGVGAAVAVATGLCCGTAFAHALPATAALGRAASFAAGFAHPFTGVDHVLGMLAVGLWAGMTGGRALWLWPAAFVGLMCLGGALGMAFPSATMGEGLILASVVVLGLLLLGGVALPALPGALLLALFALAHGHAHGGEMPAQAVAACYAAGFMVATASLHAIGIGLAVSAGDRRRRAVRGAGAVIALAGALLATM
jgi:urease accessory protein